MSNENPTPQNDPIALMTDLEIQNACADILGTSHFTGSVYDVGLMIKKLQEWKISFTWTPGKWKTWIPGAVTGASLQILFLRTAQDLGHWTPPQKKVEDIRKRDLRIVVDELDDLHERLERLEAFIAKRSEQFPDLG